MPPIQSGSFATMIRKTYFIACVLTLVGQASALNLANLLNTAANTFVTESPSSSPNGSPSAAPSYIPTSSPSASPSFTPTSLPSAFPSSSPTLVPSSSPTSQPSSIPSLLPTSKPTRLSSIKPSSPPTSLPSSSPTDKQRFHVELSLRLYRSTQAIFGGDNEILSSAVKDFTSNCVPGKHLDVDDVEIISQNLDGAVHVAIIEIEGRSPYDIRSTVEEMIGDCFEDGYDTFVQSIQHATEAKDVEGKGQMSTSQIIYTIAGIISAMIIASTVFLILRRRRNNRIIQDAEYAVRNAHYNADTHASTPRRRFSERSMESNITFASSLVNIDEVKQSGDIECGISYDEDSSGVPGGIPLSRSAMDHIQSVTSIMMNRSELANPRSIDTHAIEKSCGNRLNCYQRNQPKEDFGRRRDEERIQSQHPNTRDKISCYPSMARVLEHRMSTERGNDKGGSDEYEGSESINKGILFQFMSAEEEDIEEDDMTSQADRQFLGSILLGEEDDEMKEHQSKGGVHDMVWDKQSRWIQDL